jgi:ABC-type glycerol-3-phosphate transport system substrate-binding protein
VGALLLLLVGCGGGGPDLVAARLDGQRIEVLATWSGVEQERFEKVLASFQAATGAEVTYTSARHRMSDVLDERFAAGSLPDVAFLPQPGLLADLARDGRLRPVDAPTEELVTQHFAPAFAHLASYDEKLYGVWFKAANKSLVWYDLGTFERAGVVPPRDLDGLLDLADRLSSKGIAAFAVAGKDGWTLTDWFENDYLRTAGRSAYDDLAAHRIPWTHPTVVRALILLGRLLAPGHLAGGTAGALRTSFEGSVQQVFGEPGRAAMVSEGDFVGGEVTGGTKALLGVDADVFPFPPGPDGLPAVVGGGDVAVLLTPSPAAAALVRYLATPEAAAVWAAQGGFVSPNLDLDLSVYPDDISRTVARQLLEAGEDFRFDLSDLQPAAFGGTDAVGLRAELIRFLARPDVAATTTRLEAAAVAPFEATS